jgi:predicted DNA-binding transcriptional regulator YafY
MPKNQDALFRQWHMLRRVPRYPQKITVQDIRRGLVESGFDITERSIQRDLNELSDVFPLYCDDREKPFGWSWQKDAASFDLPGLSVPEALTLAMAEQHLRDLLPAPMVDQLQPYFKAARRRLDAEPAPHRGRSWLDKVRSVPPTQPLLPPKIDVAVQHVVSEALLYEKQVTIRYRKRGEKAAVEYRIHPLALIQRGPMLYLSCRIFDYEDARTLALNRIQSAELLEDRAVYPKDFSIERQAEFGTWGFGAGEKIKVELIFQGGYGDHLFETPLSKDQVIEALADNDLRVTATVADTPQLKWWLLGFGEGVEVVAPSSLRDHIGATATELLKLYGGSQNGRHC